MGIPEKNDPEHWKSKYLHSLDEQEAKEKEWADLEALLKRAMSRLVLAGYGWDPSLDRRLDQLRSALRKDRDTETLCDLAQHIGDTAARLQEPDSEEYSTPVQVLQRILESAVLPVSLEKETRTLKASLQQAGRNDNLEALVRATTDLLAKSRNSTSPADPGSRKNSPAKSGLLSHLFGDRTAEPSPASNHDSAIYILQELLEQCDSERPGGRLPRLIEQAQACTSAEHVQQLMKEIAGLLSGALHDEPGSDDKSQESVTEVLLQLLERFTFPGDFAARVQALQEDLETGFHPGRLPVILDTMATMVEEVHQSLVQEKREMEDFLKGVTDRLLDIDSHLRSADESRQATLHDGRELQQTVRDQMRTLRSSVATANDLQQLKSSIVEGMDTIEQHINLHQHKEQQRQANNQQRINQLSGRLAKLRDETRQLQGRLQHSQAEAAVDRLTGLANRRGFDARMEQEFARWERYGKPLSMMVLDVDHFKAINDGYGHQAGDKALHALSGRIRDSVRTTDFIARYGGEEFAVIMPETIADAAFKVAEKLRLTVETAAFHYRDKPVRITISCGIAQFRQGDTPERVFNRADAALYNAKHAGRNQCKLEEV